MSMLITRGSASACARLAAIVFSLLFCLPPACGQPRRQDPPALVLTILHTNDLHSHYEPFADHGRTVGGMARITHLIRAIRSKTPNLLTVDAGDIFQGTSLFKIYHGEVDVAMLNQAGYDLYTIGNHEFDDGPENLARQLKNARFDIVSANIDASSCPDLAKLIKPSVVKQVAGQKIGFVGAITPDLEQVSPRSGAIRIKGVSAEDPPPSGTGTPPPRGNRAGGKSEAVPAWIQPIKEEVSKLTAQGIDKIILVTHTGVELDGELAREIPEVDAIIGGHSHTRLARPLIVHHADGTSTVIVQAGCYGRNLGKLELAFDSKGRVVLPATRYRLIGIRDTMPEAADVKAYLTEKSKPIARLRNTVAGVALGDFDNSFRRYPWDSPIGDLICDALADAGTAYGATISLQNRGGIRSRIERGIVNLEKIEEVLPFDNVLLLATVPGDTLRRVLEYSVSGSRGARFLDVRGLRFAYDPTKAPGNRLVFVQVDEGGGKWEELKTDKTYKTALNNYTFAGGEGYEFSGATNVEISQRRLAEVLAGYLVKKQKVRPILPSRIVPVTGSLLTVEDKGLWRALKFRSHGPVETLTLVIGTKRGVAPAAGGLPVPLADPVVTQTGCRPVANSDGTVEFTWSLPLAGPARHAKWACVLAHPPKPRSADQTIITAPVKLHE